MTITSYTVKGMTCGHCANSVSTEISAIGDVHDVAIDLASGQVTVTSARPLDEQEVTAAIEEAGYELAATASVS